MNRFFVLLSALLLSLGAMAQHDDYHTSFSVGYINKEWISDMGGKNYHENIFGQEGKQLHGVQLMFNYSACMPIGLGVHTGLGYEWCMSYSKEIRKMGFDRFNEHSVYVPVHAMWRIPLGNSISLSPYCGVAINWKVEANFKRGQYDGFFNTYDGIYFRNRWGSEYKNVKYGNDGWPNAFNTQLELGFNFRIDDVILGFTYSKGLTDHRFYKKENARTRQDKLAITLGVVLDDD